jgi:hypothetical protein
MVNIICKNCFLFQVEIKKNVTETVAKRNFLVLVPQIKPYSTSCRYPLKNYLTSSIDQQDQLRLEQLKMYEVLLDQTSARARSLLGHQPFLKPLLEVLNELRWDILYKYNFLNILFVTQVNNQLCKKNMYRCWTEIIK